MLDGLALGPLVVFAAAMCLTPRPNVVLVTASAANFGFRRAAPQMLGVTLGFGAEAAAAGLGLAGLFAAEPRLHTALKYAGGAYLLYLAWRIARADAASAKPARARPIGFAAGALITWLNPKGWVTTIGALSAFMSTDGSAPAQIAAIAGVLAAACGLSLALWAAFGAAIARALGTKRRRAAFNGAMAALLVISLVPVFW